MADSKRKSKASTGAAKSQKSSSPAAAPKAVVHPPATSNSYPLPANSPQFAEPAPTPDPTKFTVKHGSDTKAYSVLDSQKSTLKPRPFPVLQGTDEPRLDLASAYGPVGDRIVTQINDAKQIVFHALGDTGSTRGPTDQNRVTDKMDSDYEDTDPRTIPSFMYHLGDVVYSFGESQYYYDQFYEPYRNYPAPIFAIAGNHDGMVSPFSSTASLKAFLDNFCAAGEPLHRTPEAGELVRTAQIQPAVYFTLEAPFVRILGLYSNCLEDPGVISSQGGTYPYLGDAQLTYLKTALDRVSTDKFEGAVIIAMHHPAYVVQTKSAGGTNVARHGGSPLMLDDIDAACAATGVWPHAVLSGHAHSYQRFTRAKDGRQTPFLVCGNGGHALSQLTRKGQPTLRAPLDQPTLAGAGETVTFENYDDSEFGYLRITVNDTQLRIEYHPASDGEDAKTPDDSATVDLKTRTLVHYTPLT
jgi:hypothetical protein